MPKRPVACKKSELVAAINSYATARVTGDTILINVASQMLQSLIDSLEYPAEEAQATEEDGGAE